MKIDFKWTPNMLLLEAACEGNLRLVGGAVRDMIAKKEVKDYDFCTPYTPINISLRFRYIPGLKLLPTGVLHGTITAAFDNGERYEITTLRRDVETDGRHAKVAFTHSWEEDAARRDFTINAMSMDSSGTVYDYFDGISDLENGIIKFIGKPEDRIREDYLRILRYFRFKARYGACNIHNREYEALFWRQSSGLVNLSGERIWTEFKQILMAPQSFTVINPMNKCNIFGSIFAKPFMFKQENFDRQSFEFYRTPETRIGHIFQQSAIPFKFGFKRLKVSNLEFKRACYVVGHRIYHPSTGQWSIIADNVPVEWVKECSVIDYDWDDFAANPPKFPINGNDVMAFGFKGVDIGAVLQTAKLYWHEHDYLPNKEEILEYIKRRLYYVS